MDAFQVTLLGLRRDLAASGSAIKGVQLMLHDAESHSLLHLATVGYDQRLSLWRLSGFDDSVQTTVASVLVEGLIADSVTTSLCQDGVKMSVMTEERDYSERGLRTVEREGDERLAVEWVAGDMVNVSDVCSLDIVKKQVLTLPKDIVRARKLSSFTCAVAGEGFQLMEICICKSIV